MKNIIRKLKPLEEIKALNRWLNKAYPMLVKAARSIHRDPYDLVHHTYLRILRLKGVNISRVMDNPSAYFRRAMFIESTRGEFKKEYEIKDTPQHHLHISNYDLSQAFLLENFHLAADRLSWFDKTILNLYCDGFNLTQVARESGIKSSTIHTSLYRSRKKLKVHFNSRMSI